MTAAAPARTRPAVAGVALFAELPTELASLYEALLGVQFEHRVHGDGREHFVCALDGVQLEIKALHTPDGGLTPDALGDEVRGTSRAEVSFTVPDVEQAYERAIALRCTPHEEPEQHAWGTFGTVVDPEGNRIGLYTPPAQAREGGE